MDNGCNDFDDVAEEINEIWDLMSFKIWRLDQISDITEYSPKKKSKWAITFPHNLSSHIQVYPG